MGSTTPNKEADTAFKTPRSAHNALRRAQYKRVKRVQQLHAVKASVKTATASKDPIARKAASARRGDVYRTWKPRAETKLDELQRVVKAQQAEIEQLRQLAQGGGGVPTLEPVATPRRAKGEEEEEEEADDAEEVDSSPVKIQEQLIEDLVASSKGEGVVEGTTGTTGIETELGDAALLSVEAEEANATVEDVKAQVEDAIGELAAAPAKADTPLKKSRKDAVRESSADTSAETPRNIRRSPRKRTVKRKSLGGS